MLAVVPRVFTVLEVLVAVVAPVVLQVAVVPAVLAVLTVLAVLAVRRTGDTVVAVHVERWTWAAKCWAKLPALSPGTAGAKKEAVETGGETCVRHCRGGGGSTGSAATATPASR